MSKKKTNRKKKVLALSLFSLLVLFSGYIFQVNSLTATAYHVTTSEQELKQLIEQQKTLEASRGNTLSFSSMASLAQELQFERTGSISYIQVGSGPVAQQFLISP